MPTLKASKPGIARIKHARNELGWSWSTDDDTALVEASLVLEPDKDWFSGGPYAKGISEGTWKRFLAGRQPIGAAAFKAYCEVLGLNWEEVVDRRRSTLTNTHQDWGEAIDISIFYGRRAELGQLEQWIVTERCRLVALAGMGGIGKTALSVKLAEQIQHHFDYLIWRSLRNAPPVGEFLADLIEFLSHGQETNLPETVDGQISRLIQYLNAHRCLLLLDDVETVLRSGELAGQYLEGYQGYGELIRRVAEERHQSCLLLATREKPIEISSLAGASLPVRDLRLKGLLTEDAKKILEAKGFSSLKSGWEEFIQLYRGNPLALNIVATTIQDIFNGDISQFLEQSTLVIGDTILSIVNEQFERLSELEREIIYWLSLENQPVSLYELRKAMRLLVSSASELLTVLESLKRRSLFEEETISEENEAIFTLQPVVRKYVINQVIEQVCKEVITIIKTQSVSKIGILRNQILVKNREQDSIKKSQNCLLLTRVIDRLQLTSNADSVEEQLNEVLSLLQGKSSQAVGYAESNILNLLGMFEENEKQ